MHKQKRKQRLWMKTKEEVEEYEEEIEEEAAVIHSIIIMTPPL
jgi:hypothetical protein